MTPLPTVRRGQLVVVTAFLLAALFVGLAIVTNTAIFTENLSTRDTTESSGALLEMNTAVETMEVLLDRSNAHHEPSHKGVTRQFTTLVDSWSNSRENASATKGVSLHVTIINQTNGTYIRQLNNSRDFTDASDSDADWTLAENVTGVGDYRLTVNRGGLATDEGEPLSDLLDRSFTLSISNESGTTWKLHVYENAEYTITVRAAFDGHDLSRCEVDAETADIDLVAGTVGGDPCPRLSFATGLDGPIDLEYLNPEQANGTYEVRVDRAIDAATDDRYEEQDSGSPSATPHIYAAEVQITYSSSDISVQRRHRLVAGDEVYESQ